MKKIISIISVLLLSIGFAFAQGGPKFKFKDVNLTHDFGNVKKGTPAEYYFEFTNDGDKPLVITNVNSSCGCTKPEWNSAPVMPGKKEKIKVGYRTDKVGPINRVITVRSNAGDVQLKIIGEVKE